MHIAPFNRPPRVRPRWNAESIQLPAPPARPARSTTDYLTTMMPLMGAGLMASVTVAGGGNWLFLVPTGAMAGLGVVAAFRSERRSSHRDAATFATRQAFFEDQLASARSRLHRLYDQELLARLHLDPDPETLLAIVGVGSRAAPDPRLWERRPTDDDFLRLRLGLGDLPAACQVVLPPASADSPVDLRLPRLAAEYATLRQVPITLPLAQLASLGLAGPRPQALALLAALVWQAVTLHAPADLRLALVSHDGASTWEWLRWLPHTVPLHNDPAYRQRMCATSPTSAARLMSDLLDHVSRRRDLPRHDDQPPPLPRLLLLVDGAEVAATYPAVREIMRHGAGLGMAVVVLVPSWPQIPEACAAMLDVGPHGARSVSAGEAWPSTAFQPDLVDLAQSDRLARRLAAIRLQEVGGNQDVPRQVRLFDLLGLRSPADLAPPRFWADPPAGAWRSDVPIGALAEGQPIFLDLSEQRHGPHGIIAGATGAGKSVLLQSVIAALVVTHHPDRLQVLLIDFKGGAALSMFAPLPHVAGLVTDLEGRLAERAMTAITSELRRRKALLKTTAAQFGTKVEHIGDYRALAALHDLPPLPNLLIVVDEFDEMAANYQEFVHELVRVVKQGRSLGVHLLVATQQPARAVSDEIRSQLKFFIALRLGSSEDSREMILKPDAAFLPTDIPGRAYFRAGNDLRLFQVAQVTNRAPTQTERAAPQVRFVSGDQEHPLGGVETEDAEPSRETDLDHLVRALAGVALETRQPPIWRVPLPGRIGLGQLVSEHLAPLPLAFKDGQKIDSQCLFPASYCAIVSHLPLAGEGPGVRENALLSAPIGLLDIPQECRQEPLLLDLTAAHLALIGASGSGKTMLLRTLVLSLALRYAPRDLWCYLVDAGGQGLAPLAGLPHVGALIQARERERVRRLIRILDATIRERQDRLRAADLSDFTAYRAQASDPMPALLVIVDKVAVLSEEFRDAPGETTILDDLVRIARVGRSCGIILVLSADRANDLSYRLLSLCEARLALRQTDLHDYTEVLGARVQTPIPPTLPGRALWLHPDHGPLEVQTALPTTHTDDPTTSDGGRMLDAELSSDLREQVQMLAQRWQDDPLRPQPVELLPERISLVSLPALPPVSSGMQIALGREALNLEVAALQLSAENPHALLVGPRRSGKTTLLRTIIHGLVAQHPVGELELLILDGPRRGLADLHDLPHTTHYARAEQGVAELIAAVAQLRMAASGPRRVIIIDDYTLCRERMREHLTPSYGTEPNLLANLCDLAQSGGMQGVHILLTTTLTYADDALLRALDAGRNGAILWPGRYDGGTRLLGVSLPLAEQRDAEQPPGRALLVHEESQVLVQIAVC